MKKLLILLPLLVLGCEPLPQSQPSNAVQIYNDPLPGVEGSRFSVTRHGQFKAGFENNKREILIIKDTKTGVEFLCVTDCSIVELVSKRRAEAAEEAAQQMLDAINTGLDH